MDAAITKTKNGKLHAYINPNSSWKPTLEKLVFDLGAKQESSLEQERPNSKTHELGPAIIEYVIGEPGVRVRQRGLDEFGLALVTTERGFEVRMARPLKNTGAANK
jgi:hypothetical protein